jgi:ABC-type cobalamin/Fe3+-siderophores transport system ATPase subunit
MPRFEINGFPMDRIQITNGSMGNFFITGENCSGKSTLITNLITNATNKINDSQIILFASDYEREFYSNIMSNIDLMYNRVEREYLEQIYAMQCKENSKPLIIIFDVRNYHPQSMVASLIHLITRSRHVQITFIISGSPLTRFSPEIRNNFDYVFASCIDTSLLNTYRERRLGQLYDQFFGTFNKFHVFKRAMEMLPSYSYLVMSNREREFSKQIAYFTTDNTPIIRQFQLSCIDSA